MNRSFPLVAAAFLASLAAGCSSDSRHPPALAITSPAEGARITGGTPSVTVTGTVHGASAVTVATNGGQAVQATVTQGTFSATLPLDPRANAIVATATNSKGTATAAVDVFYPFLALSTFQAASIVIGQADFVSAATDVFGTSLYGNPGWDGSQLYLPDYGNGVVQVFAGIPVEDGVAPAFALSEAIVDAETTTPFNGPQTVQRWNDDLLLLDYGQSRVLVAHPFPTADGGATATVAIGQPDLTSTSGDCTAASLSGPESFVVAGGKLIVADSNNDRVLVWNSIPTSSGQAADLVLGQADFTSCTVDAGSGAVSAAGFDYPSDVWSDGTRLYVVDYDHSRVLGWNTFPTTNGQPADFVLGQPDFETVAPATAQGGLANAYFVTSNGNQLFLTDTDNNRVLVWNTLPTATGALPDVVLGQGDFDHTAPNDADQDGTGDGSPAAFTLSTPRGLLVLDDLLVVGDADNARYLVYR